MVSYNTKSSPEPFLLIFSFLILSFCTEISVEPKVKKTQKYHYKLKGVEIVLKAYCEISGWDEILMTTKERLCRPMARNFMKNTTNKDTMVLPKENHF